VDCWSICQSLASIASRTSKRVTEPSEALYQVVVREGAQPEDVLIGCAHGPVIEARHHHDEQRESLPYLQGQRPQRTPFSLCPSVFISANQAEGRRHWQLHQSGRGFMAIPQDTAWAPVPASTRRRTSVIAADEYVREWQRSCQRLAGWGT
jgi:hypothetical protein